MTKPIRVNVEEFAYNKRTGIITMWVQGEISQTRDIFTWMEFNHSYGWDCAGTIREMAEADFLTSNSEDRRKIVCYHLGKMLGGCTRETDGVDAEPAPLRTFSEQEMKATDLPEGVRPGSAEHASFLDYMEREMESSFYGLGQNLHL